MINIITISMVLFVSVATAQAPPININDQNCMLYRNWQKAFKEYEKRIMNDEIEYLSWRDFVDLKEGNIIAKLEYCPKGYKQ